MRRISSAVAAVVILLAIGGIIRSYLDRERSGALQRQLQIKDLEVERDQLARRIGQIEYELERSKLEAQEIHRLRAQLAKLRRELDDVNTDRKQLQSQRETLLNAKAESILRRFQESAAERIPELALLKREDILRVAARFKGTETAEQELAKIRTEAKIQMSGLFSRALVEYLTQHGQSLPERIQDLSPYLSVDPKAIERYFLARKGSISLGRAALDQNSRIIEERPTRISVHDTLHWVGFLSSGYSIPSFPGGALSIREPPEK